MGSNCGSSLTHSRRAIRLGAASGGPGQRKTTGMPTDRAIIMRHLITALVISLSLVAASTVHGAEDSAGEHGSAGTGPFFIEFNPFSVSVIQRTRVAGFLSVAFQLVVESEEAAAEVERMRPKLNDAIVRILSRVASSRLDINHPVDVDLIRTYLQLAVDSVIGKAKAGVLMQTVSLQPA